MKPEQACRSSLRPKQPRTTNPRNEALPATAWTVGNKKMLVIRVDFSDLTGEPKRGSTTYTAAYVQNIADVEVAPYYAQSSFGAASLTTTVTTQVYRMPQTASAYAVGDLNAQHDGGLELTLVGALVANSFFSAIVAPVLRSRQTKLRSNLLGEPPLAE
mgnify:CR=1 FL=1